MKLLEAIAVIAEGLVLAAEEKEYRTAHTNAARRFLFGGEYLEQKLPVTSAASALVRTLELNGDDFEFIKNGANSTVYGNDKVVFKLASNNQIMPFEDLPEELVAKILNTGDCNGVKYALCERLNTERTYILEEIIPFLFKLKDAGFVYGDTEPDNFGHDHEGNIKLLDHKHIIRLRQQGIDFRRSLAEVIRHCSNTAILPMITSDADSTYVVFDSKNARQRKKLLSSLSVVGIHDDKIEVIDEPPIVRIKEAEVNYGTPPHTEDVEDYIVRSLETVALHASPERSATGFLAKLSRSLTASGQLAQALATDLPSAEELTVMDRTAFTAFYDRLINQVEQPGVCSDEQVERIDAIFDAYFRLRYPPKGRTV